MKKIVLTTIIGGNIELVADDDSTVAFLTQFANRASRAGIRATDKQGIMTNYWFNFENIVSVYAYDAE